MKLLKRLSAHYSNCGQYVGAAFCAPSKTQVQVALIVGAFLILGFGIQGQALAAIDGPEGLELEVDQDRIGQAAKVLLDLIEGAFGALVMVVSGMGAIMSCAFGQYKAALNCLIVACGSFILRSILHTFFRTDSIDGAGF